MASQNECPTIEEVISDEVRRQFGTRTFQAYEKRPERKRDAATWFPETSPHFGDQEPIRTPRVEAGR